MCTTTTAHEFYITGAAQQARQDRFCWLCPDKIFVGDRTLLCRCGNGPDQWHIAHQECARRHPMNITIRRQQQELDWPEPARPAAPRRPTAYVLADGDPKQGRYRVMLGDEEEWRSPNRNYADGAAQYLNEKR